MVMLLMELSRLALDVLHALGRRACSRYEDTHLSRSEEVNDEACR
jgi:hypothetical protein